MNKFNNMVFIGLFSRYGSSGEYGLYAEISNTGEVDSFFYMLGFEGERRYLTMDDATMLDHTAYSVKTEVPLDDLINEALRATYVFEAGLYISYEGSWRERLFSTFDAATTYAKTLSEYAAGSGDEIFASARMVIGVNK